MNTLKQILILLFLFTYSSCLGPWGMAAAGETSQPDAAFLVAAANDHMRGETQYAETTMKVIRPDWSRETSLKSWSKGRDYMLLLITAPARDKGTAFLKRKNEVWNWLPSVERVIKIPPSMMMQPWMGSDFTNDDLVRESSIVNDYTHSIEGEENVDGRDCWKVLLTPKPDAPVVWGKLFMWIDKVEPIELRIEYYDEDDHLVNVQSLTEIEELGGRRIPSVMTMTPVDKPGHSTVLVIEKTIFDEPIDDSFFSEQQMKRLH
jgi:outer membrane lipoprotein-sorting protein